VITILCSLVVFDLCSSANKCLLKVAQFSAQRELFEKAAEIYEQVGFSLDAFISCVYYAFFYIFAF